MERCGDGSIVLYFNITDWLQVNILFQHFDADMCRIDYIHNEMIFYKIVLNDTMHTIVTCSAIKHYAPHTLSHQRCIRLGFYSHNVVERVIVAYIFNKPDIVIGITRKEKQMNVAVGIFDEASSRATDCCDIGENARSIASQLL